MGPGPLELHLTYPEDVLSCLWPTNRIPCSQQGFGSASLVSPCVVIGGIHELPRAGKGQSQAGCVVIMHTVEACSVRLYLGLLLRCLHTLPMRCSRCPSLRVNIVSSLEMHTQQQNKQER